VNRIAITLLVTASTAATADPLRLRADALASTASPAGLLVLETDGVVREGMSAEAVVWMANAWTPGEDTTGDVLVIALRARTRTADARIGRFVSTLGAIRPVHVDGGSVRVHLPRRFDVEVAAGIPVVLGLGTSRSWDWIVGSRVSHKLGDSGSFGVAYAQQRDDGRLAMEELGFDAGLALNSQHDLGARAAYDLANPGVAEVALTSSSRVKTVRTELYAIHRAASHLLPATSLFSVLGDVPSERVGSVFTWRAAPRLDVIADLGARLVDGELGAELVGRARLRLDDRGKSAVSGELRRSGVGDDTWSGARAVARIALPHSLTASTELELVIPDVDRGRGSVWPWALAAVGWDDGDWQAAVAVEASATAEYRSRLDVLAQLGCRWGAP
jgi:hypothetical protein